MVGVDPEGYVFIYDAGNRYIRIVDLNGEMFTLIDGACMQDLTVLKPQIPFQLELIPMLCYKAWIDKDGFYSGVIKASSSSSIVGNTTCLNEHYVNCPSTPSRPLIMEKNFTKIPTI